MAESTAVVDAATLTAEESLRLLREGRYPELNEQADEWRALAVPLGRLRDEIRSGAVSPVEAAEAADAAARFRERIHALRETLRHVAMVENGLREIEAAFRSGYSARGQVESEGATRLSTEA